MVEMLSLLSEVGSFEARPNFGAGLSFLFLIWRSCVDMSLISVFVLNVR